MRQSDSYPGGVSLRNELAQGDATIGAIAPIMGHLLTNEDNSLFTDEIVARVRGTVNHIAWQMLAAQALCANQTDPRGFADAHAQHLMGDLVLNAPLITHCHALALEWQLTERLERSQGIDPVVSPFLQTLIGSANPAHATSAMKLLTAQARFGQAQRRMELPLNELPADLLHQVLLVWRAQAGGVSDEQVALADRQLRAEYDEGASRLGLLSRVIGTIDQEKQAFLSLHHAGAAIFLSALASASGQKRDFALVSTHERQIARLAIALRAAGLDPHKAEEQVLLIHPDAQLPEGLESLSRQGAQDLLSGQPDWSAA